MNLELLKEKAKKYQEINLNIFLVSFTLFGLIVTLNKEIFQENQLLAMELVISIPLLTSSIFSITKITDDNKKINLWNSFRYLTFMIAYGFLINVTGLLIEVTIGKSYGIIFLLVNLLLAFIYSTLNLIENPKQFKKRIIKDLFFTAIIIAGGLLPMVL